MYDHEHKSDNVSTCRVCAFRDNFELIKNITLTTTKQKENMDTAKREGISSYKEKYIEDYKELKDLGLEVHDGYIPQSQAYALAINLNMDPAKNAVVKASDLLALVNGGIKVSGYYEDKEPIFGIGRDDEMTHTALLISIKPLEKVKPVRVEEIESMMSRSDVTLMQALSLLEKIQKQGIEKAGR